jgi:hypothetical protein
LWAAFTALVNQQAVASGSNATVGFINPALSVIGKGSSYASCFHDITTGDNMNGSKAFYAVPGYDLCTGWGTPRGSSLINALVGLAAIPPCQLTGVIVSNGTVSFALTGIVGWNYAIDVSSDLVNWLPVSTNTIPGPVSLVINDPEPANKPMRFYRARPVGRGPSGAVIAWGNNGMGQTNVPANVTNVVAVAAHSDHSLALKADGTVVGWGNNGNDQVFVPVGLTNVVAIAAGFLHNLALRSDGTVVAWGYNGYGEGHVPAGLTNAVAIAAGVFYSLALKGDGSLIAWGGNAPEQTNIPAGLGSVVAIAGGDYHCLALKADGTVAAWGSDGQQQTNVPLGLSNVVAIAAGSSHSLALKADGTVVGWGDNSYNAANGAGLTNVVAISAGNQFSLALKADGTVVAWGQNDLGQSNVPVGLTNIAAIAAGDNYGLAMLGTGLPNQGLIFQAPSGAITFPFITTNGYIYQPFETNTLAHEGRAVYNFTLAAAGNYVIRAAVNAPNEGANSFFMNIDAEPQDPYMVWDIPVTAGFEQRVVSWRGNGTFDHSEFVPKVFSLTQGSHQLIIRGREATTLLLGCVISKVP